MEQWSHPWNEQEQKMKFAYRTDEFLQDKYPATGHSPVIHRGTLMNESSDLDKYKFQQTNISTLLSWLPPPPDNSDG